MQIPEVLSAIWGKTQALPEEESLLHHPRPRSELRILLASSFPLIYTSILQGSMVAIALLAHGAGLSKAVGLHTQRMAMLLLGISIPIGIFWFYSQGFLQLLLHDKDVCKLAETFMRILVLGNPGFALFESGKRYLQAQGHFAAGLYTFLVCIPIHIVLTWYLVFHLHFGIEGTAVSMVVTRSLLPFGLILYSWLFMNGDCWRKLDRKDFENWAPMVKLAIPSCLMIEVECVGFEILTVLAGLNGTAEMCAQVLLATLCGFIFKIPYSISIATSTQVADLIGKGSEGKAKDVARYALWLAGGLGSFTVFVLFFFRHEIPHLFTNDATVATLMLTGIPIISVFQLVDAIAGILNGVIRGMGKQYIGAWIQTLSYYAIGLPCSIAATFGLGWHLVGLWSGISLAMLLIAVLDGIYVYFLDWSSLVEEAKQRNARDGDI